MTKEDHLYHKQTLKTQLNLAQKYYTQNIGNIGENIGQYRWDSGHLGRYYRHRYTNRYLTLIFHPGTDNRYPTDIPPLSHDIDCIGFILI